MLLDVNALKTVWISDSVRGMMKSLQLRAKPKKNYRAPISFKCVKDENIHQKYSTKLHGNPFLN